MQKTNNSWQTTYINLTKKPIYINKIKYTFGNHKLGSGAFGSVYPARRSIDGLFYYFIYLFILFIVF